MSETSIAPKRCEKCGHVLGAEQKPLTKIEAQLLRFICDRVAGDGCAPTFGEIAKCFGWSSLGTVSLHIEELERKGYIRREPRSPRGITVLVSFDEVGSLPMVTKHG
jgi:repressor LexA